MATENELTERKMRYNKKKSLYSRCNETISFFSECNIGIYIFGCIMSLIIAVNVFI